jgi:hypothetical protein
LQLPAGGFRQNNRERGGPQMRSFILTIIATLLLGGFTSVPAQAAETIKIKVNHQKNVVGGRVSVRFAKMIEDSRCPHDVQCIQAGNARVSIRVSRGKKSEVFTISTDPRNEIAHFEGYEFRLVSLSPEPRSNIRINPDGYVATIEVSKR